MEVRSGCAYVMPPNTEMVLVGGRLCLAEPEMPRGQRLPIDYFFRSLAADQGERAVGTLGLTGFEQRLQAGVSGVLALEDADDQRVGVALDERLRGCMDLHEDASIQRTQTWLGNAHYTPLQPKNDRGESARRCPPP